jgi:hypothetical protein
VIRLLHFQNRVISRLPRSLKGCAQEAVKMPIDIEKIKTIIKNRGTISFDAKKMTLLKQTMWSIKNKYAEQEVYDCCYMATSKITDNKIEITACKEDDPNLDSAFIKYEPQNATMASVKAPAMIYTNEFSGCTFFLFRGPQRYFHGVHAHRGDNRFIDPTKWFEARGGKRVCLWPSKGKLVNYLEKEDKLASMRDYSVGVLACINVDRVDVFAFIEQRSETDTPTKWGRKIEKELEGVQTPDWALKNL